MDRPRHWWGRSLLVISGTATVAFAVLGLPAGAAGGVTGTVVVGSGSLSVRSGPGVSSARVGLLGNGRSVTIDCQVAGERIAGRVRTTDRWDRLTDGTYVSDAYIRSSGTIVTCGSPTGSVTTPDQDGAPDSSSGGGSSGRVAATVAVGGGGLNVRRSATTASSRVGSLPNGRAVSIDCQVTGQWITGSVRGTDRWARLADGTYVADGYLRRTATPATCDSGGSASAPSGGGTAVGRWVVPLPGYRVGSGFRTASRPNHDGVDIAAPRETPILAAAAGVVVTVTCNASTGNCDVDGSPSIGGCGWYVEIRHSGNVTTRYCHMVRRPDVSVGQAVAAGQVIGRVGTSGNSSGPHLHFEVHTGSPATRANAVDPVGFMRSAGAALS